jgi:histidine triad (HIT) family protein
MAGLFAKIAAGEIPSYKIAEDENYFAFLDINPLSVGHTLVIPKKEVDYIFDLDKDLFQGLMEFARKMALAQKKVIPCLRIGVIVAGLEVPHAHVHLVPLHSMEDLSFKKVRPKVTPEEFTVLAEKIGKAFAELG